ncbi:MAG: DUF4920 domain-containing protein [Byssovorax sp.]
MRITALLAASAFATLALAGCAQAPQQDSPAAPPAATAAGGKSGVQQASATSLKPLATRKFGAEITEKSNTTLDSVIREPARFTAKTVRTEGVVTAVCQEMGCWMEITDEAGLAHIKMAGHAFFIPREASGHRAAIQGKILSAGPAGSKDHCTEEAEAQTGQVAKVQIEATGVEFLN